MDFLHADKVSLVTTQCYQYPGKETFFRPDAAYPEYPFGDGGVAKARNAVYSAVRESLRLLGLDEAHYGTAEWNPLGKFISPGDNVLIKPNLVMENNPSGGGTDCLYTQPAVVAPMIDYALIALQGRGKIVIGDAPMQECKFEKLVEESGYRDLVAWYRARGCKIELVDFRELNSEVVKGVHVQHINESARGKIVELNGDSEFAGSSGELLDRMRVTNYDPDIMKQHHTLEKHEYYVSDYVLNADCIINMPKPKSHRKAGATIALKNMVGINLRKEFLPHHTMGSTEEGGDEYEKKNAIQRLRSRLMDRRNQLSAEGRYAQTRFCNYCIRACSLILMLCRSQYFEGSWYGNHTISRTIADLNKIVYYADKNGKMRPEPQRKAILVADMIVSGEKEGPVLPSPKAVGMIAAGVNPVCFDEAIAALMGFDRRKIPALQTARNARGAYKLVDESAVPRFQSNSERYDGVSPEKLDAELRLNFIPTNGWKGHIEI